MTKAVFCYGRGCHYKNRCIHCWAKKSEERFEGNPTEVIGEKEVCHEFVDKYTGASESVSWRKKIPGDLGLECKDKLLALGFKFGINSFQDHSNIDYDDFKYHEYSRTFFFDIKMQLNYTYTRDRDEDCWIHGDYFVATNCSDLGGELKIRTYEELIEVIRAFEFISVKEVLLDEI